MTALKPIENRLVTGVAATNYPVNDTCSHPECAEPRNGRKGAHHIFPRSLITNASYFVKIEGKETITIPHVTWLCPPHHDAVEMHKAWIKLEEGEFVWYDRGEDIWNPGEDTPDHTEWGEVAPLDPQPAGRVKANAKPKKRKTGAEARKTRTKTFRFPDDMEDGRGMVEDNLAELELQLGYDPPRSQGWTLMDATNFALMWVRDQ